ncbi:ubiquinone/menaquinone biosynthesis C-methylase UbiE [Paenibacillus phyllosphaerae]|uniref:Ubiquinone/menaquinone biosynthesis C-methylase UbiE n=1 Tax=Paenibacillus phyllosphaerae TaxID=274593 RepID=A0A7W5B1C5_9BACL|nr:class I SAM-dependent methyltransferase [Paenibacillus phyllosphaerae]MBB3112081.1 ubiquinone/menaquinone biosynthesis C-methylase UbiE [Paenibacillus phyllosphaerae]
MEAIIKYYSGFDEWGRLDREPVEMAVNLHYMRTYMPSSGRVLDIGAGPGKYAMQLAASGYRVTLADLTPRLVELARQKAVESQLDGRFDGFHVADACDLSPFEDDSFEAAIMLGPMYHLQAKQARERAVRELNRVTKRNGVVCVAFMPKNRHLAVSLANPLFWKPNHTAQGIRDFAKSGCFNHTDEGRFTGAYYEEVEAIKPFMEAAGFETLALIASESIAGAMGAEAWAHWRSQGQEAFEHMMQLICERAADPSILGSAAHLMYVGRKC